MKTIWYDIVDWWNGVTNYEPGEIDPFTGLAYPRYGDPEGDDYFGLLKVAVLGWLALQVYSEIKSPTKKTKTKRFKAGRFSVG